MEIPTPLSERFPFLEALAQNDMNPGGWSPVANLLRRGSTDDLHETVRTNPFVEGRANLIRGHRKILLRGPQTGSSSGRPICGAGQQSSGHAVFTRFRQRNLPQQQRLGLLQFSQA